MLRRSRSRTEIWLWFDGGRLLLARKMAALRFLVILNALG